MPAYTTEIKPSYQQLRSLYIPRDAAQELDVGTVTVLLDGDPNFAVDGLLSARGLLSGMAKLYNYLGLKAGSQVQFQIPPDIVTQDTIVITSPESPWKVQVGQPATVAPPPIAAGASPDRVFRRRGLRHLHIEAFRPENLNVWEPETEPDVYLAFGVLQSYTDYQYCCGASKALLTNLGADYSDSAKPDAILIDRTTGEYLMAEWKKYAADYKLNHKPADVDVLVCWFDNETDRTTLPPVVLALHGVAKRAAEAGLNAAGT